MLIAPADWEGFNSALNAPPDGTSKDVGRISVRSFCLLGRVLAYPLLLLTGIDGSTALMKTKAGRSPEAVLSGDAMPKVFVVIKVSSKLIFLR
jgi:hypothetical protein